jgi:hypothetical protein
MQELIPGKVYKVCCSVCWLGHMGYRPVTKVTADDSLMYLDACCYRNINGYRFLHKNNIIFDSVEYFNMVGLVEIV